MIFIKTLEEFINEQYLNDNFLAWFGDSKIVDSKNNPLKVYHGTYSDFDSFSDEKKGTRTNHDKKDVGLHFTNDPKYADIYAGTSTMQSYIHYTKMFPDEEHKVQHNIRNSMIIPVYLRMINPYYINDARIDSSLIEKVKKLGCDGIIGKLGDSTKEYVVFYPNQIKSAIGNNGNFDIDSQNLTL